VFKLFPKVTPDIVDAANLLTSIVAEAFISAFTITPLPIVVVLPTEVISPFKLYFNRKDNDFWGDFIKYFSNKCNFYRY
jgi:hypothetical protein